MRTTSLFISTLLAIVPTAACTDDPATPDAPAQPDVLALPGVAFYPESLHAAADGTLYVGSLGTGSVVAFAPGATTPTTILAGGGADGVTGVTGVLVHDQALWVCSVDTSFMRPTEVKSFTLTGTPIATFPLAAGQFCNDLTFDPAGALYAADSFGGTIQRLAPGAQAFSTWLSDPSLQPASAGQFGLDGIAWAGDAIFVNKLDTGGLYRVANHGGERGALTQIAVRPPLVSPDGMRALDANTLLVIEGGHLTRVEIDGEHATATPISDALDMPTSVVVARGAAWVTEGQLGRLFAQPSQAPVLPFSVRRVDL